MPTDPTTRPELLPCPFCGRAARYSTEYNDAVDCLSCGLTIEERIWLRRTPAPAPQPSERSVREVEIRAALSHWAHAARWEYLMDRSNTVELIERMMGAHCNERSMRDLVASGGLPKAARAALAEGGDDVERVAAELARLTSDLAAARAELAAIRKADAEEQYCDHVDNPCANLIAARAECLEQARLLGISGSVEARLRSQIERLRARVRELEDTQWGGDDEMPERDDA